MKLLTVLGARPQFVKAAVVSRALATKEEIEEIIVHTGQHFDQNMSSVFFSEMEIPLPKYQLDVNSLGHGAMTGKMLQEIEKILLREKPDALLIYGDTNSTLAGALAAIKLHIPIAHIEAGMRSYNKKMPEEINRVLSDHCTDLFFTSSENSKTNLIKENIPRERICVVGDVMYDAFLHYKEKASKKSSIIDLLGLDKKPFSLITMHRASNTDKRASLEGIIEGICPLAHQETIIFPLHPRTRKALESFGLFDKVQKLFTLTEPLGYFDMIELEQHAQLIFTDSGGVQKEAYFARCPCITLREETEWTELVDLGVNKLVGSDAAKIQEAIKLFSLKSCSFEKMPYGMGNSGELIANELVESFAKNKVLEELATV